MMYRIISATLFGVLLMSACYSGEEIEPVVYQCEFQFPDSSAANPNHKRYQQVLNNMTASGVVGVSMAVYKRETGLWLGAAGKADLFNQVNLKPCSILRVGSTVKMLTATTVLKLAEEGKLNLDDKIASYLDGDVIQKIENADQATIRQLLQHSAGLHNYIQSLKFQTASLNDLLREWHATDLLPYSYNQASYFKPGTDVRYSNTGYILLGMLIEKVEGKPFYKVFADKIFQPLGLTMTRFAATDPVPDGIARGYIDLYSNLQVIESTYYSGWDYYTADGGLISNPHDLQVFFRALLSGKILNNRSLSEMMQWQTPTEPDTAFFPISYGLGIFKIETPQGTAYMHSGDAIGYYANMLYFPEDETTIVYAVNSNYGKIDQFVSTREAMTKLIQAVR